GRPAPALHAPQDAGLLRGAPHRPRGGDHAVRDPHRHRDPHPLRPGARGGGAEPGRPSRARVLRDHPRSDQTRRGGGGNLRLRHLLRQLHAVPVPHQREADPAPHRALRLLEVLVRPHRGRGVRLRHRGGAGARPGHRALHGARGVHGVLMRPVTVDEIQSLASGAWILGTGGGGSPYLALLNMRELYKQGVVCQLMDAAELHDDDLVAVVSNMGAPLVGQERLTDPKTMALAVTMMEEYLGRRFRALMSLEIGGGNSIQPFMGAAMLDLPVIDGDCMGRAFPEAQMTSFAIHDLRMYPLPLADVRDNAVVVARAASWKWMERISRKACVEVGSIASTCKAPRTGKEIKECAILGSTTKAIGIGRAVQAARKAHRDPID